MELRTGKFGTPAASAQVALAQGDLETARRNGLTMNGDQSQLTSLFSVPEAGDRNFSIIEP